MNFWNKSDEPQIPPQTEFYSELTMENITNSDYRHAQRVFKIFNNF